MVINTKGDTSALTTSPISGLGVMLKYKIITPKCNRCDRINIPLPLDHVQCVVWGRGYKLLQVKLRSIDILGPASDSVESSFKLIQTLYLPVPGKKDNNSGERQRHHVPFHSHMSHGMPLPLILVSSCKTQLLLSFKVRLLG